ncbi:hypothetical protein PMZ80_004245 [Knufia obscura]|uniref:Uncharacterized protein n=1 Tax=Knufia obscura TaxID=1635080 RepID=A0ABR0RSK6_9EURO|nr:hypothetical protein PMZ80_004245 [Knufia obscura]
MADLAATISTNAAGGPEIGPEIPTILKGAMTKKSRVVLGWNHQNDTPNGLRSGKVWGWVSEDDRLQVYDENFNRSKVAGQVRFCGVANFTIVRMFHPYWARRGRAPRDMNSSDKRWCRTQYRQLMRKLRIRNGLPVDDEPDNPIQPDEPEGRPRKKRGRPSKRSRGGRAPRSQGRRQRRREASPVVTGTEEQIPGYAATAPMTVSDDEDSEWNDNIPLAQRNRSGNARPNLGNMRNVINSIFGNSNNTVEEAGEEVQGATDDKVKDEEEIPETAITDNVAAARTSGSRARSIVTPPLNEPWNGAAQAQQQFPTFQENAPALPQLGGDGGDFENLRNALADTLNEFTTDETLQEITQGSTEDSDFMRELEAAATMVETETEVKRDEDRVVNWVSFPITPISEVIVIED